MDGNLSSGFVVGDFTTRSIELLMREEMLTEVSREHLDYFVKNIVRSECGCANGLYRPSEFCAGSLPAASTELTRGVFSDHGGKKQCPPSGFLSPSDLITTIRTLQTTFKAPNANPPFTISRYYQQ